VLNHDWTTGPLWRRRAISDQERSALPAHVPSLEELYSTCGIGYELSLDLKDPAALEPVLAVSQAAGGAGRLWLCTRDWILVPDRREQAGEARLVESTSINSMPEGLEICSARLAAGGVDAVNLHGREWDPAKVSQVHDAGLCVFGWDAQTERDIRRLIDLGVDGIYSDHVRRMMSVIASTES
jgi:glycerophosphoryl diester phosphodiesterase